jgi:hypothetical protein
LNFLGGEEYWYSLAIGRLVDLKTSREGREYRYSSAAGSLVELKFAWRGRELVLFSSW